MVEAIFSKKILMIDRWKCLGIKYACRQSNGSAGQGTIGEMK
jgi:hypothetical protein